MVNRTRRCLAVVLAAGEGKRMRSSVPKVLHRLAHRTLLAHVIAAAKAAGADGLVVVAGPERADVAAEARENAPDVEVVVQAERLGTAHAVLAARDALASGYDDLLVLYADVPLIEPDTLGRMRAALAAGAGLVALGFEAADPSGYGRLVMAGEDLLAIREDRDATVAERAIKLCNSGLLAIDGRRAASLLGRIGRSNAQGEYYLTDVVELARREGLGCAVMVAPETEVMGVNDRAQLASAEAVMQSRLRARAMREGATLIAPGTVFLSHDTALGRDVTVEPNVVFGPGVKVEDGAVIHAFSHVEGARLGPGVSIGPFARIRPGTVLGAGARIGNFVETKNAAVGEGAKVNHLSYIGDASVGAAANIGAGTITCNYDGFSKARTEIGANAFVGSNSSLVAPVAIGADAIVGSGSVVTADVPDGALALGRARQVVKEGWGTRFRARRGRRTDTTSTTPAPIRPSD